MNFESVENIRSWNIVEFKFELRHIPIDNPVDWSRRYVVSPVLCRCESVAFLRPWTLSMLTAANISAVKCQCCKTDLRDVTTVTDNKEYLYLGSVILTQLNSAFTRVHVLNFLCRSDHFTGRYGTKQKWVFFSVLKHSVSANFSKTFITLWLYTGL